MKEVFDSKKKIILFSLELFLLTAIIINIFPNNLQTLLVKLLYPLYFFILTFGYSYRHNLNWDITIILMMLYMIVGYFCLFDNISGIMILESLITGFLANIFLIIFKKKNKHDIKYEKYSQKIKYIINFSIPLILILILEIYFKICTFEMPDIRIEINAFIIMVVIIYAIFLFLLSILRDGFRTNLIFSIIFLILFVANQMRIFYTSDTLLLTDFLFLQTTGEIVNFVDVTLINAIKYILTPTIIVIILFTYLLIINYRYNIKIKKIKIVIPTFFCSLFIILVLFIPLKNIDKFILNKIYDNKKVTDYTISVSNTRYYYKYGVISGMYGKFLESRRYEPENYDEEGLKYIINNAKRITPTWKKPNVIVIFSESFWDISALENIKFDKDIIENFHKLQNEGKVIDMISPAYGGVSANVEFEILTGGSLNYFSKGYIPYMQLYDNNLKEGIPSIITEFKNNEYKTVILNSSSKNMFNCDRVYNYYQVDEKRHLYDEIDLNGKYVSDKYLTDEIIKYFNNKNKNEKTFYFTITMGGHMPYYEERYKEYDFSIVESPYNSDINGTIKAYAEGIYKADLELGRLYDYIKNYDEDTIIVFFGDHLPHLQTENGYDALFETGYLNNEYDLESVYRQFNTKALILSNYDLDFGDIKYLSPDLLFTYIMNNMDLELSPFYKWLYTTIEDLPSSNYVVSIDNNGNLYYTLGLEEKMKNTYELREKVQYMLFR